MRIRRRATDVLHHPQAPSSSQPRFPAAAPPSPAPPRAPAPRFGTPAVRRVQPPVREVDLSMREAKPFDPRWPSRSRNRQEEEEESDKATEDEKRGKEDGRSEYEHGRPVHVVCRLLTRAAPKGEEEERRTEVEEKDKSDDSRPVKDEEKTAAMCKKGDGKGWHCKRVAQGGYSLCQYHLDKLRSYSSYSQKKKKKKKKKKKPKPASATEKSTAAAVHHQEASQKKNKKKRIMMEEHVPSTGPGTSDSFYYYSGFGPRWGKRRGDRPVDVIKAPDGGAAQLHPHQDLGGAAAAAAAVAGGEEDGYDCDASSRDGKPLKSRALSSL